jgi:hypothetical protein
MHGMAMTVGMTVAICGTVVGCVMGAIGCGGCSSPHPGTPPPPPGDGGAGSDADSDGSVGPPPSDAGPVVGTLRVDLLNRRYFTAGSGAVFLTGSHTWANFKDRAKVDPPPAFDYTAYLDFLAAHRHNFIRLWTWEQPFSADDDPAHPLYFTPFPWPRTGPGMASDGKPRFDLDARNDAYFDRLRARVIAARDRGIYVSIMLFDGWDLANGYSATGGFPMAAGNNVNGVAVTPEQFLSVDRPEVTARQQAYVRAVIDKVNDLDNVLYEIANEANRSQKTLDWHKRMIKFVHDTENAMPKQHPVGMTSMYPGGQDAELLDSEADWISPVGRDFVSDGTKVVLNDTDHSYGWVELQAAGAVGQRAWAWKTLCRGAQPLFMDPYLEKWAGRNEPSGKDLDTQWKPLRDAMGFVQLYATRIDLERAVPSPSLCSTGFCLADPGHQYLVYQPGSGAFTVTGTPGDYRFEWFDPETGKAAGTGMVTLGAGPHSFTPPFAGDAVLLLQL